MNTPEQPPQYLNSTLGSLAAFWGIAGTCLIMAVAVYRMSGHVQEGFLHTFSVAHYALLVPWLIFMLYSEGYKGFQKGFSPRVGARASYLRNHATPLRAILAPLFCMGFFDSTKKRKIVLWSLFLMITLFVIAFQFIPQPWRGILDLGVVFGLSWGIAATIFFTFKYCFGDASNADPEIPAEKT